MKKGEIDAGQYIDIPEQEINDKTNKRQACPIFDEIHLQCMHSIKLCKCSP